MLGLPTGFLQALDEGDYVAAANLPQTPDLHARNLPRPQQVIGGRAAHAELSGELFCAQEFLGSFGLRVRKHPDTSVAVSLPLSRWCRGRVPAAARVVPLGSLPALSL